MSINDTLGQLKINELYCNDSGMRKRVLQFMIPEHLENEIMASHFLLHFQGCYKYFQFLNVPFGLEYDVRCVYEKRNFDESTRDTQCYLHM